MTERETSEDQKPETGLHHWPGIRARLRRDWSGLFFQHWPWWLLLLVTAIADGVSTWLFMQQLGAEAEFHPAIRLVSIWFGPTWGTLIGKTGQVVAIWFVSLLLRRWTAVIIACMCLSYSLATCWNLRLLFTDVLGA